MAVFDITDDTTLKSRVRNATGYEDNQDELPETQLDSIVNDAKLKVAIKTGSEAWYTDRGLSLVLYAYTCMRAKAAVENIAIVSYSLGNESVNMRNADPEDSQQIQQWADDIRDGLDASDADTKQRLSMANTSGYIGEQYIKTGIIDDHDHDGGA